VVGRFWAERGYTAVIQGTRGRYESGGVHSPLIHERGDGLDTLAWLKRQPWFDGRLGMWGGSAFGHTQWAVADQLPAAPSGRSALMVQISSTDFHGMFYPGGAFSLASALFWAIRSRGAQDEWPDAGAVQRGAEGVPLLDADRRAIADVPFFNDWAGHPVRDAYWQRIDGEDRAATLQAPALLMAGWFDPFLPGQLADFVRIRRDATRGRRRRDPPHRRPLGARRDDQAARPPPRRATTASRASRRAFPGSIATCVRWAPACSLIRRFVCSSWGPTSGATNRSGRWRARARSPGICAAVAARTPPLATAV
jgi:putative CocE/NonD family hydrolase